jgi:hypothetical protein
VSLPGTVLLVLAAAAQAAVSTGFQAGRILEFSVEAEPRQQRLPRQHHALGRMTTPNSGFHQESR